MNGLICTSIITSIIAIILLGIVIMRSKDCGVSKESLCLCNNLGGSIYKSVDYNPAAYNYKQNEFGF
jgi:hypothetical protein